MPTPRRLTSRGRLAILVAVAVGALLGAGAQAALAQGTLIVCQSSANGMTGTDFQFSVNGGTPFTVGGGRCSGALPTAAGDVTVRQLQTSPETDVSAISVLVTRLVRSVSPNPNLAERRVVVRVSDGTTTLNATRATFTNEPAGDAVGDPGGGGSTGQGTGVLEVCKLMAPGEPAFDGRPFEFRIDGGLKFIVRAGRCSQPRLVAAGNHTITELPTPSFELVSVDTLPAGRLVSQNLAAGTGTVSVPPAGQGETLVLFRNRVARGQVKLCKAITSGSADALGTKAFTLRYTHPVIAAPPVTVTVSLRPGECSLPSVPIPVIDASGNPTLISVDEQPGPGFVVDSIHLQGTAGPLQNEGCPVPTLYGCFPLGRNTNSATFTNRATDP
jgi:hypothetical protein